MIDKTETEQRIEDLEKRICYLENLRLLNEAKIMQCRGAIDQIFAILNKMEEAKA